MIYEFEDTETGDVVEVSMPMADAPPIGETIERGGRVLRRLVSSGTVAGVRGFQPFVSHQLPRNIVGADDYTPDGRPIFTKRSSVDRLIGRQNAHQDTTLDLSWD